MHCWNLPVMKGNRKLRRCSWSAEPIPELFRHLWYLQNTYLLYGYNQAPVYESYDRIREGTLASKSGQSQFHRCYHTDR